MQKVRGHPCGLPPFVGMWFQILFHSPLGVLFTFPSRYSFTIGQQVVLSLGGWSPQIPSGLHVAGSTQESHWPNLIFAYGGITLYPRPFQVVLLIAFVPLLWVLQPRSRNLERFGLVRVRSPLLAESRLISFPTGTEMFQFPAFASLPG
jgi:hypothetical protein